MTSGARVMASQGWFPLHPKTWFQIWPLPRLLRLPLTQERRRRVLIMARCQWRQEWRIKPMLTGLRLTFCTGVAVLQSYAKLIAYFTNHVYIN